MFRGVIWRYDINKVFNQSLDLENMPQDLSPSADTRIAVLEKIAESHDKRISDMEDFHRDVVDRLDQKIQLDASNQIALERTLSRAVVSLESLNTAVRAVGDTADLANKLVLKHEYIGMTLMKVGTVVAIVISGAWAAFTYLMK